MDIDPNRYQNFNQKELNNELLKSARDNKFDDVALLIQSGANVNTINIHGETALIFSAYRNNLAMATLLIQHGAKDINSINNKQGFKTALMVAADCNAPKIVELLLDNNTDADMKTADRRGRTAIDFSMTYLHNEMSSRFFLRMAPSERAWLAATNPLACNQINQFRKELKFNASKLFNLAMRLVRLGEKSQFIPDLGRKIGYTSLELFNFPSWHPIEEHMTLAQQFIKDYPWKGKKPSVVFLYNQPAVNISETKNNKRKHGDDNKGPEFKKFK